MHHKIKLLQINAQCSNFKTHTILNKTTGKYNIILIQEAWISNIGGENRGPPAHKAWQPFIPIQTIWQEDHIQVMAYFRHKRTNLKITMCSDIAIDPDPQILKIMHKAHPPNIIFNLYNAKDANNVFMLDRINHIPVPQQQNTIYTGDWNLHCTEWSKDKLNATKHGLTTMVFHWPTHWGYPHGNQNQDDN
jgi:hypothetical protein